MSTQAATKNGNIFAVHQLIALTMCAVFSGATFTTAIPARMLAFSIQQTSTEAIPSLASRMAARADVQYGRNTFVAEAAVLAAARATKPQKKYRHDGASVMVTPEKCNTVWYHIPPISQAQNTRLTTTSEIELASGIRLGSRTGGSLSGSHFSMNPDFSWTLSRVAKTTVMLPIIKNAIGQNATQNEATA